MPRGRRGRHSRRMSVDSRWKVGFAAALAIVVEHGKKAEQAALVPQTARCPRCGLVGATDLHFGTRVLQGKRVAQSWCRNCRAQHLRPKVEGQVSWLDS